MLSRDENDTMRLCKAHIEILRFSIHVELATQPSLDSKPEIKGRVQEGGGKDVAPVTPPVTKGAKTSYCTSSSSTGDWTKAADKEYVDMKAFVVHGVPCHRPMADTIQDVKRGVLLERG
ncbi:hypothetical protein BGX38DRAFT_1330446 [Terfezia claveryi]|nr:hypothetical protein BGX38DRAFT_1330446 [Terfezia claveryi]